MHEMGHFPAKILAFKHNDTGDAVYEETDLVELADHEGKTIELAFDYGKERIYVRFDLLSLLGLVLRKEHE